MNSLKDFFKGSTPFEQNQWLQNFLFALLFGTVGYCYIFKEINNSWVVVVSLCAMLLSGTLYIVSLILAEFFSVFTDDCIRVFFGLSSLFARTFAALFGLVSLTFTLYALVNK